MRIMVTGGRDYNNLRAVKNAFNKYVDKNDTIVEGGCSGADALCAYVAHSRGIEIETHNAHWDIFGRSAGPRRNAEMASSGIDFCLAFPGGAGTENAIKECIKNNVKVIKWM